MSSGLPASNVLAPINNSGGPTTPRKGPPKFKQRQTRQFKSKPPKKGVKGFGDDIPGMEGLGTGKKHLSSVSSYRCSRRLCYSTVHLVAYSATTLLLNSMETLCFMLYNGIRCVIWKNNVTTVHLYLFLWSSTVSILAMPGGQDTNMI
ncbi:hypothetical protein FKM82_004565 [Ascaphus truei]